MASSTKKQDAFLSTPLSAVASLTQVPGIGPTTLEKLARAGISTPSQLLGQFLLLDKEPDRMRLWLRTQCGVREREAAAVSEALFAKANRMEML